VGSEDELRAEPYWARIPDGEYLALCTGSYFDKKSRTYGLRIYLDFQIFDGPYAGTKLRAFYRPKTWPSSNYYPAWSIANGSPPRSRNTRMSPKIFEGKLFCVRTTTVRRRQRFTGPDGKRRPGRVFPETLWYSKVDCILSLEATNQQLSEFSSAKRFPKPKTEGATPFIVTGDSSNPSSQQRDGGGQGGVVEVGSMNLGAPQGKSGVGGTDFSAWREGEQDTNAPPPAGGGGDSAVGHTPSNPGKHNKLASPAQAPPYSREHLKRAIFRAKLFQAHDAMSLKFGLERCIEKLVYEAAHDLCMDRARELAGVSEGAIVEGARARLKMAFSQFEVIRDWERRRNVVVGCVVNAVVDAALAIHTSGVG
jgi:hypothetical protein